MEPQYSYTTNNSVSSSSSSSQYSSSTHLASSSSHQHHRDPKIINEPIWNFSSEILRKIPHKIKKKPIAPMIPTPPKVYNVDAKDFRDVVQKLTGASDFRAMRLREVVPTPLSLSPAMKFDQIGGFGNTVLSPLGFGLSPASLEWCASFLSSPINNVASVESSAVLN